MTLIFCQIKSNEGINKSEKISSRQAPHDFICTALTVIKFVVLVLPWMALLLLLHWFMVSDLQRWLVSSFQKTSKQAKLKPMDGAGQNF